MKRKSFVWKVLTEHFKMLPMGRGRPKQFDDEEVLAKAMWLFWRQGYEATSLDQLVDIMGIPRQSLYRTFTDKHTLFLKAIEHYEKNVMDIVVTTLNQDAPAIDNLRAVFNIWNVRFRSPERLGCLMVNTSTGVPIDDKEIIKVVKAAQQRAARAIEKAIKRAQAEGDIDEFINAKAVSRTIAATVNGLLAMTRTGLNEAYLDDVLATLPALLGIE